MVTPSFFLFVSSRVLKIEKFIIKNSKGYRILMIDLGKCKEVTAFKKN